MFIGILSSHLPAELVFHFKCHLFSLKTESKMDVLTIPKGHKRTKVESYYKKALTHLATNGNWFSSLSMSAKSIQNLLFVISLHWLK
jgi:hypothetical protein